MTFSPATSLVTIPSTALTRRNRVGAWRALAAAAALAAWTLAVPASALGQEHAAPAAQAAAAAGEQQPAAPGAEHTAAPAQPAGPGAEHTAAPAQPAGPGAEHAAAPGQEAQPPAHDAPHDAAAAGAHGDDAHSGESHAAESPWGLIGKLFNFAILAGSLVYLLKSPLAAYLSARATTIRADLKNAEETRVTAGRQLEEIEGRMRALPGEIQALTDRGKREIAAEEARIREAAEAERQRMLDQSRREIDLQVRTAERTLKRRAGELAVQVAAERVKRTIGAADQARLVDKYLGEVGSGARG